MRGWEGEWHAYEEELTLFSIVDRYKKRPRCWVASVNEKWRKQLTLKNTRINNRNSNV